MNTNITIICNNIQNGLYSYGYLIMFISLPNQIELILMLISSESYLVISIYIQYIPYLLNYKTFIIINLDNYISKFGSIILHHGTLFMFSSIPTERYLFKEWWKL